MKRISLLLQAIKILLTPKKIKVRFLFSEAKKYFTKTAQYRFINCEQRKLWATLKAESFITYCIKTNQINTRYAMVLAQTK